MRRPFGQVPQVWTRVLRQNLGISAANESSLFDRSNRRKRTPYPISGQQRVAPLLAVNNLAMAYALP